MEKKFLFFVGISFVIGTLFGLAVGLSFKEKKESFQVGSFKEKEIEQIGGIFFAKEPIDYTNPKKPRESPPVEDIEKMAKEYKVKASEIIKLVFKDNKIIPDKFEVKAGKKVVLALSSQDNKIHIFKFREPQLKEVAVGLYPKETRMITFFAPKKPGVYHYFCEMANHQKIGEKGQMIVKE